MKIYHESCFTTGSGFREGTGVTRWLKSSYCFLTRVFPGGRNKTSKTRETDDLDIPVRDPALDHILPSGDAVIGIDYRSWM